MILVMTTLGRWLEATGRLKATSALDALTRLLPVDVRRLRPAAEEEQFVPLAEVKLGDLLRILPGERFPADGQVERNAALVDEQVLTGESRPVLKEPGARILGGTLNLDGDLVVRVNAVGPDGTLARLVEMVKQARLSKGRYQRLVDRISTWFFPAVAGIAVLAFVAALGIRLAGTGAHGRAGRQPDRLPLCAGAGHAAGGLERDRPGRESPGPLPQRRGTRAAG